MTVSKALLLECEHSYAWSCTPYLWLLACLDLRWMSWKGVCGFQIAVAASTRAFMCMNCVPATEPVHKAG